MKSSINLPLFLIFTMLLIRCSSQTNSQIGEARPTAIPNILEKPISKNDFAALIKGHENAYVVLTADWCGGGRLQMNNFVLPNINRLNQGDVPLIVGYMGDFDNLGLIADSLAGSDAITLYHIEDVKNNAFFHKMAIRKILKEVGNLKYDWAVPVLIEIDNGRASYLEKSFDEL